MKKRIKLILFLIIFSFLFTESIFAVSGACSSHEGVNCSMGRQLNGKVICNDGWTDSIADYDFMAICKDYKFSCGEAEWNNLSKKYGVEELFFKMQEVINNSPFNQTLYNLLNSQYQQADSLAKRDCYNIGADKFYQKNFERMQLEVYNNQIEESQKRIEEIKEEENKLEEWYRVEMEKLDKLAQQTKCSANSIPVGDKCQCISGYELNITKTGCIKIEEKIQINKKTESLLVEPKKEVIIEEKPKLEIEESIKEENEIEIEKELEEIKNENQEKQKEQEIKENKGFFKSVSGFFSNTYNSVKRFFSKIF